MPTIELVALDLDGTLVGRDLEIHPRVKEAVARLRGAKITGCLVTGRMYKSALPFVRSLELDAPVVCYQGAAIVDPESDTVLFDEPMPNVVALEIARLAKADDMHVQLYRNDNYYCEQRNRFSDLYARVSGVEPVVVSSLEEAFEMSDATKAVVIAEADVAAAYASRLQARLAERAYITRSEPEFVEILNPLVDKGKALQFVAARLGVAMENVMAIGDSWNDAPLLKVAGIAVAMGSAPAEIQKLADLVVGDVAHDGVAEALEQYVPQCR